MARIAFLIVLILLKAAYGQAQGTRETPNVIILLADDLGWADLACYGNAIIETPNLDRLARQGMRFTDAYAPAPICSASRAALLTGKSPARLRYEFVSKPDGSEVPTATPLLQPDYPRDLRLEEETLAEALPAGYRAGFFGKWHLTQENDTYLGWGDTFGPLQQGFMEGTEVKGSHPYGYTKAEMRSFGEYGEGEYPPDALTDAVVGFLRENKANPFLLYFSMYYVHTPVRTRCSWLYDKYRNLYGTGASDDLIQYAAFVETMDAQVGTVMAAMDDLGLAENTVVIFASDNGGHPRYTDNGNLRGSKWNLYEGGIRTPMIVRWPGIVKEGTTCHLPVNGTDIFPTISAITRAEQRRHLDGHDLTPLLRGLNPKVMKDRSLYWHFPFYHPQFVNTKPQSAIRKGRFKLVYFYEDDRYELYDLKEDRGEEHDLANKKAGVARDLKKKLFSYLESVNARFPEKRSSVD